MKITTYCFTGLLSVILLYSCAKTDPAPETPIDPVVNYNLRLLGSVKSCSNGNVTNGDVLVSTRRGAVAIHITNGSFDTTFHSPEPIDSIFVWAVDLDALTTSDTMAIKISGETTNLGQIAACAHDVDEYVRCSINNESYNFVPALYDTLLGQSWDTLSAPTTYIYRSGYPLTGSKFNRMQFNGMSAGTFFVNWNSAFQIGRYYCFNPPTTGTVTYTSYGNVGGYITGNINVPFLNNNDGLNYTLTGSFKVRRDADR